MSTPQIAVPVSETATVTKSDPQPCGCWIGDAGAAGHWSACELYATPEALMARKLLAELGYDHSRRTRIYGVVAEGHEYAGQKVIIKSVWLFDKYPWASIEIKMDDGKVPVYQHTGFEAGAL